MQRILIVYFSQSGQLTQLARSVAQPLVDNPAIDVHFEALEPVEPFPFPWPFLRFFNTFPECIAEDPPRLRPLTVSAEQRFDLVILAYQVWFLSPSLPTTAFLQTPEAAALLKDTPVITLIGCRNMWLMAQETMKRRLQQLGARLIDNIVLTDSAHSAFTFISTPLWVLTGNRGPWWGGRIPRAGISPEQIDAAQRFGRAIAEQLPARERADTRPMLGGLGAVRINERLIASEKIAHRSFSIWAKILRGCGALSPALRRVVLLFYIVFLIALILTVVPVSAVIKRLISPLTRRRVAAQRAYYAQPSGEDSSLLVDSAGAAVPRPLQGANNSYADPPHEHN